MEPGESSEIFSRSTLQRKHRIFDSYTRCCHVTLRHFFIYYIPYIAYTHIHTSLLTVTTLTTFARSRAGICKRPNFRLWRDVDVVIVIIIVIVIVISRSSSSNSSSATARNIDRARFEMALMPVADLIRLSVGVIAVVYKCRPRCSISIFHMRYYHVTHSLHLSAVSFSRSVIAVILPQRPAPSSITLPL